MRGKRQTKAADETGSRNLLANDLQQAIQTNLVRYHLQLSNLGPGRAFPRAWPLGFGSILGCYRPGRRAHGFRKASAHAARRRLRKEDLAWTEPQAIHQGSQPKAGSLAPRAGPAQHLGSDAPRRVLEIRGAPKNRRKEARLIRA